jgi:DNA primase catalytic subunit
MDYNVSTMQNHLLKLPFSIHPSTHKVSVPLFDHQVESFDPKECITLEKLIKEIKQLEDENIISYKSTIENAHKTELNQYLSPMESFCDSL